MLNIDVPRIGRRGEIVELADAHAMNVIINKGLGVRATDQMIRGVQDKQKIKLQSKARDADKYIVLFEEISKAWLVVKKKIDSSKIDMKKMYAKLSARDIVDAVYDIKKVSISEKQVMVPEAITLGDYTVTLTHNTKKFLVPVHIASE